jgi:hypothetical protein
MQVPNSVLSYCDRDFKKKPNRLSASQCHPSLDNATFPLLAGQLLGII